MDIIIKQLKPRLGRICRSILGFIARLSPIKTSRFGYPDKITESAPWLKKGGILPHYVSAVHILPEREIRPNRQPERVKDTDPLLLASNYLWKPKQRHVVTLQNARVCRALDIVGPDNAILWELSIRWNASPSKHPLLRYPVLPPKCHLAGKTLFLCVDSSDNYFHWILDLLPKLKVMEDSGIDILGFDHYLVYTLQKEFQRETLKSWGIPLERVVETLRHHNIETETLVVPSWADQSGFFDENDVKRVREVLLATVPEKTSTFPKRIFMGRRKTAGRRIINWQEISDILERNGFTAVELESLCFRDQMLIFHQAQAVVGIHGAGLTNLLFCKTGTKVLELVNPNWSHWMYWNLASSLHLDYHYLFGEVELFDKNTYNDTEANRRIQDFRIDIQAFESVLKSWNKRLCQTTH